MTPATRPLRHRRSATVTLALLGILGLLGACSGSKNGAAPSTGGTSSTSSSTTGATAKSVAPSGASTTAASTAGTCASGTTTAGGQGGGDVLVPGDIPDSQKYMNYTSGAGYHLSVPDSWARSQAGNTVTFTDKFNTIRIEVSAAPTAPSTASAQSTEAPALATSTRCYEAGKVSQVKRTAGTAVLITYRGDSAPDSVTGKAVRQDVERYEFWRSGQQVTITLSSPKGSDNVDPWRKVTDSFAWGP